MGRRAKEALLMVVVVLAMFGGSILAAQAWWASQPEAARQMNLFGGIYENLHLLFVPVAIGVVVGAVLGVLGGRR